MIFLQLLLFFRLLFGGKFLNEVAESSNFALEAWIFALIVVNVFYLPLAGQQEYSSLVLFVDGQGG
jgi:hypothetical protein